MKRLFALLAICVVALLVPGRSDAALQLQPGDAMANTTNELCTLGFVADGPGGPFFLTAAHCVNQVGEIISDESNAPIGTVAALGNEADSATDWALISIASGRTVSSIVRGHGAPTGVATADRTATGDLLRYSGHGIPWSVASPLREQRPGVLTFQDQQTWESVGLTTFGDSGGPVMHSKTGAALGLVSRLCFGLCEAEGPTIEGILQQAAVVIGGPLTLRTS